MMQTHAIPENRHTLLEQALKVTFDMAEDDAEAIARVVADAFAGDVEVPDDVLTTDLRSIFYTLEAKKLLTFRREEQTDEAGSRVRMFYWHLREDNLRETTARAHNASTGTVYDNLPATAWARGAS